MKRLPIGGQRYLAGAAGDRDWRTRRVFDERYQSIDDTFVQWIGEVLGRRLVALSAPATAPTAAFREMETDPMQQKSKRPLVTRRATFSRRDGLKLGAAGIAASLLPIPALRTAQAESTPRKDNALTNKAAIRPFQVGFPETKLTELRRRIKQTQWPDRETAGVLRVRDACVVQDAA